MLLKQSINRIILFIICILPFIFTPNLDNYYFIKAVVLIICTLLILLKWLFYEKNKKAQLESLPLLAKITAVYWVLNVFSLLFSIDRLNSLIGYTNRWNGFIVITCYCLLLFFSSLYFEITEKKLQLIVAAGCVMSVVGFLQFFQILRNEVYYYPLAKVFSSSYGTTGNPNYLGAYLVVLLSISIYLYLDSRKIIYLLSSSLMYGALLTTMTRGAWLGAIFSITVLFAYYIKKHKLYKNIVLMVVSFISVTIAIDLMLSGMIVLRFFTILFDFTLVIGPEPNPEAGSFRIMLWTTALSAIPIRPFFGVGSSNMHYIFSMNPLIDPQFSNTHNEFIHIAATTGIPSAIAWILMLAQSLRVAWLNLAKRPMNILFLATIAGYAVQSFFSSSIVSFSFLIWICMGSVGYLNSIETIAVSESVDLKNTVRVTI